MRSAAAIKRMCIAEAILAGGFAVALALWTIDKMRDDVLDGQMSDAITINWILIAACVGNLAWMVSVQRRIEKHSSRATNYLLVANALFLAVVAVYVFLSLIYWNWSWGGGDSA